MNRQNIILIILLAGVLFFVYSFYQTSIQKNNLAKSSASIPVQENDSPKIASTKPDPLEEAIIGANETIEITFNKSLENEGELKLKFEPKLEYKIDYKIELSQDRKTAKIIPLKPYELGSTYTLFIGPDTKFDGVGAWGQEKIYHFKTIRYRGV